MKKGGIVVIGSSNTDMVIQTGRLPAPGETILGGQFIMNPGGKGANQAVAAARLDGEVTFIARVGNDIFGQEAIKGFQEHGIDISCVAIDNESPSGVALIMVDDKGENCISVALGANLTMQKSDIDKAKELIKQASFVLIQLEIPMEVVTYAVDLAKSLGTRVVLNPAPAQPLSDDLLSSLHIITPNETETALLTGIKVEDESTARKAARILKDKGVDIVLITMGERGAYVLSDDDDQIVPSTKVIPVDTTAAGDTFNGALLVGLSDGLSLTEAVEFANKAAAFSVTKMGAQVSAPSRNDIK
ncbi:MAG: ribokinase [Bacteroidetes bacterium]|nr:ribokinase [Bacteroidota bacterium]MDA1121865.1 ribokinase [Bacteroidota bacterium]